MDSLVFLIIALGILGFGLISGRIQNSVITPPMIFVLFGVALYLSGVAGVELHIESRFIEVLASLTLILVLFTDAARIDLSLLRREHNIPIRLLVIGLPLTIFVGAIFASVIFDRLMFWEAAVLAAILSPTDAALGQAVVSNPQVPVRVRQALNIESGLNDGIMLPVILLLVSFAEATGETAPIGTWLRFAILQVVLGLTVGVAVGYIGGKLVELASRTGWMNRSFQDLSALGLSLMAYAAAELVGGNGFISAFCAGLTLGNTSRAICTCLYEFAEAEGQLLTLLIFTVFGAVMVPLVVERLDWMIVLYGFLSLTVIRMVPVGISLIGSRLRLHTKVFLGWFGPRGIASILFALLVVENSSLPGRNEILFVVVATVLLSVFSHGLTAFPAAKWYSVHLNKLKGQQGVVEHATVTEMPTRLPYTE